MKYTGWCQNDFNVRGYRSPAKLRLKKWTWFSRARVVANWGEKGVRLAQETQVGPCTPVGTLSGERLRLAQLPTRRRSHLVPRVEGRVADERRRVQQDLRPRAPGQRPTELLAARAENRSVMRLSALRAHTKAAYRTDSLWETLRPLNRPGRARTGKRMS
jgi:hypothetical protein